MMWLARLRPLVAVAAALILATAGVAVQGRQQPAPDRRGNRPRPLLPRKPARRRRRAERGGQPGPCQGATRPDRPGLGHAASVVPEFVRIRFTDPCFSLWARRKLETLRKTGAGKAEIVAALEKYIDRLKQEEAIAENEHQAARATEVDVDDVRFRRLEAEIWLNEEKAR